MLVIFGFMLIIIVLIRFRNSKDMESRNRRDEFLKKERESHFVPRKDISKLSYLTIDYASLPFHSEQSNAESSVEETGFLPDSSLSPSTLDGTHQPENAASLKEELSAVEFEIRSLEGKRILNLTGISNTDLRIRYGTANLEPLSAADQNFTNLVRALQKWGTLLVSTGSYDDAITVLSYAVAIGSDITGTYALLARLYKGKDQYEKIDELKTSADKLTTLMKPSIKKDLDSLTEEAERLKSLLND